MARKSKTVTFKGVAYTVQDIKDKLATDDRWLYRGIKAIYDYQTLDEQRTNDTHESNGVGFNSADAELLTSYAKFLQNTGFLTPGQLVYARKKMAKYAGQLFRIVESKTHG